MRPVLNGKKLSCFAKEQKNIVMIYFHVFQDVQYKHLNVCSENMRIHHECPYRIGEFYLRVEISTRESMVEIPTLRVIIPNPAWTGS